MTLAVTPVVGPFTIGVVEGTKTSDPRGGTWKVGWKDGQVLVAGWKEAITWLDAAVRRGQISDEDVILAGSMGTPWILEFYLEAAEAAEIGFIESIWDAWAVSAKRLYGGESVYADMVHLVDTKVAEAEDAAN